MLDNLVQALMPKVEILKSKDAQFRKDFESRKDEMADFAKLFYDHCKEKGSGRCAVFGSDDELFSQLVHYFHEPKGTVKSLDINVTVCKVGDSGGKSASNETKTSGAKAPAPKPSKPTPPPAPKPAVVQMPTPTPPPAPVPVSVAEDDDDFDPFA